MYIIDEEDGGLRGRNSEDEYEFGSFIVDDDEDVGVICKLNFFWFLWIIYLMSDLVLSDLFFD